MYTMQEVINEVYNVFVTRETQFSYDGNAQCLYQKKINGVGCAIGIFMDNQKLAEVLDENSLGIKEILKKSPKEIYHECDTFAYGYPLDDFVNDLTEFSSQFPNDDRFLTFLLEIQGAHDSLEDMNNFISLLETIANDYELELPE